MSPLLTRALADLEARGLNLACALTRAEVIEAAPGLADHPSVATVLVLGSGGRTMWPSVERGFVDRDDPVDEHALDALTAAVGTLEPLGATILWPSGSHLPVTRLGELAGWSHPSPMGLGIHPAFGLWFAYRGVIGLEAALPSTATPSSSPCDGCVQRPCIAACPADVLSHQAPPKVAACFTERLRAGGCESSCVARRACPVGAEHGYVSAQEAHHHRASLRSYLDWIGDPRVDPAPPPPPEWT